MQLKSNLVALTLIALFSQIALQTASAAVDSGRATSVTTVAILFTSEKFLNLPVQLKDLKTQLEKGLSERSLLQVKSLDFKQGVNLKAQLNFAQAQGVDGVFLVTEEKAALRTTLYSTLGQRLAIWKVPFQGVSKSLSSNLVNIIVRDFPYQGIVRSIRGREVEVSLGKNSGVSINSIVGIYDFEEGSTNLSGRKISRGKVKITDVELQSSRGVVVQGSADVYSKVLKDADSRVMNANFPLSLGVGFDQRFIDSSSTGPANLGRRSYRFPLSKFLNISGDVWKFHFDYRFGEVSTQQDKAKIQKLLASLIVFELQILGSSKWRSETSVGYDHESKSVVTSANLVDVQSSNPFLQEEVIYTLKNHIHLFGGAQVFSFGQSKDNVNGSSNSSFGVGGFGGIRVSILESLLAMGKVESHRIQYKFSGGDSVDSDYGFLAQLNWQF